ncbi:MAG: cytochrome c-type biogenesis protein CcmH [Gammaproteobacteria bacterium]|nr:cytochrome c-type biogenesis protein CcmH [Gammaproteobacteria bacterium]
MRTALGLCLLWGVAWGAVAADTPFQFTDAALASRYQQLATELRCLVCQNQSLADSHADLAQDLRNEVYRLLTTGRSDREILDFLVARYGQFVLYRPAVSPLTWLLWFGPALLLVVAGVAWWRIGRRAASPPPDAAEAAAVAALIQRPGTPP